MINTFANGGKSSNEQKTEVQHFKIEDWTKLCSNHDVKSNDEKRNMSFALDKKNVLYLSYSSKDHNELHAIQLDFNALENQLEDKSEEN